MAFEPTPEMLAEAEFEAFELEREHGYTPDDPRHWLDREENRRLREALRQAIESEKFIEPEQQRIKALMAKAKTPEEVEAREYQIWYVEKYLTRAAEIAEERFRYFQEITTKEQFEAENDKCEADILHWFKYYAWGYDPRARTPLAVVPFVLYPRQEELVAELDDIVFNRKTSLAIEKARDEGATELIVRWGIHCWLYRSGFSMLLSSRTEDEVDTKKKQGTLFERARFQLRLLPAWMRPEGFDIKKDLLPDKLIANPNGNALVGQAPVENMGRGDRVTCAMFDEFAFWRFAGYPQFRSMSQTTDSVIMPSSVAGKFNQFADLTGDGYTPKFEMDWRDNPFKDQRWYDALPFGFIGPKMSRTTIAQEVDRNYSASQPGKVWHFDEALTFITMSEFMRPFIAKGLEDKFKDKREMRRDKFKIPDDWRVTRTHDFGKSDGHDWGYLTGAQPRIAYPLHDTHFIFLARNLEPTGLSISEAVKQWGKWEADMLGLRDPITHKWTHARSGNYNSHEQQELRRVLLASHGENWTAWDTDYETGIATIEDWLTPIDVDEPNPFRPELMGRNRLVFVAPDEEYMLAYNERLQQHFVTVSDSEFGFNLCRKQLDAYHYPQSELGKPVKLMRPKKEFDDVVDCLTSDHMVSTQRGDVPIAWVTTADLVMTRQGWRPVTKAAKCADNVSTYTLTDADGRQVTGTGNHKIWTENRGFVPLRGLTVHDTVLAWQHQSELCLTGLPTTATPTLSAGTFGRTFPDRLARSMSRCGSFITAALSRRGIMFTTSITTPLTTTLGTWQAPRHLITSPGTWPVDPCSQNSVSTASLRSKPKSVTAAFADLYARTARPTGSTSSLWPVRAFGAVKNFLRLVTTGPESAQCTARAVAVHSLVKNVERRSVYNLNVADAQEYFANGILVANCVRGYSVNWNRQPEGYNFEEKVENAMPAGLKVEVIQAIQTEVERDGAIARRVIEETKIRQNLGAPVRSAAMTRWRRR